MRMSIHVLKVVVVQCCKYACVVSVLFCGCLFVFFFFFSSRRRHTRYIGDWSSDVCSSDLSGITRPKDLEGKTLAAPPGDAQRQLFPAFAKLHGIDTAKVKWLSIEPAAKFVSLSEKRADVVADYLTGLPFYEKAIGRENLASMPWHKHGFDIYSMAVVASEKMLAERPKVLREFVAASYLGWRDVMESPKAALEIFKKRVPEIDLALIEPNLMLGLELMKTERYARHGIGWVDRAKMCATVELLNTYMPDLPRKAGCDEVFTNEFLTKIEPPRR